MKKLEDYLYYEEMDPDLKIYCGDCLEILPLLPKVDLVLTSPPYNTGGKSLGYHPNSTVGDNFYGEYKDNLSEKEYEGFIEKAIASTIQTANLSFWNMQMVSGNKNVVLEMMYRFRGNLKDIFIWRKQAVSQIVKGRLAKGYEFIFLFGQDNDMTFKEHNFPSNSYVPNIQEWYRQETCDEHHATFDRKVPLYFIEKFVKQNGSVCDPFLGSGTTLVACKELNRNGIGIEINEKYCEIAKNRLRATCKPLFTDVSGVKRNLQTEMTLDGTPLDAA